MLHCQKKFDIFSAVKLNKYLDAISHTISRLKCLLSINRKTNSTIPYSVNH